MNNVTNYSFKEENKLGRRLVMAESDAFEAPLPGSRIRGW